MAEIEITREMLATAASEVAGYDPDWATPEQAAEEILRTALEAGGHTVTVAPSLPPEPFTGVVRTGVPAGAWSELFKSPWVIDCRDEDAFAMRTAFGAHGLDVDINPAPPKAR